MLSVVHLGPVEDGRLELVGEKLHGARVAALRRQMHRGPV